MVLSENFLNKAGLIRKMRHILICGECRQYTMKEMCPKCKIKTINPKPAKYDPKDPYGSYRRKAKELKKRELI